MLKTCDLKYEYKSGAKFDFPDLFCASGEILLILGQSGIGKSTLLNLLGGLMPTRKGEILIDGKNIAELSTAKLDQIRGAEVGFVFQKPHFISAITVVENLLLVQKLSKTPKNKTRCLEVLKFLGLEEKANRYINSLSEGEKQRVSIARAVINNPKIILADEPTSALDDSNCKKVVELLSGLAKDLGAALIIVTHDQRLKDLIVNQITLV